MAESAAKLAARVRAGDRAALARAITLIESARPDDQAGAEHLLDVLAPGIGNAWRIGVSGVPGVGKSTFIDALGCWLVEQGHRVAVLAVDPSSTLSGGSIMGDKTQMARLARLDEAFIRPTPSARTLGGVAARTREGMMLCEAAGYDVVLVETVGVGQSETVVADMVDCFLVLMLPGAGDELQGIKKGILEIADIVAVNKADGDNIGRAREAVTEYGAALRYGRAEPSAWRRQATMTSAVTGEGIAEIWALIEEHRATLDGSGELEERRRRQRLGWMWGFVEDSLIHDFRARATASGEAAATEQALLAGEVTPRRAARQLMARLAGEPDSH
ncbi:MAG TPA: methylmalonyl Co-A mutase-associated GTPase MeaB [Acidobacteriota bacterium]|nr:methylmalonyl Co-A mutase-associated GTPase MeaB [Acidobacteriota bacterium]